MYPLHVPDGLRHVAQLIQPNDCLFEDFSLDTYTADGKRKVDTSCEILHKESVLDEFTHDNSKIDHILDRYRSGTLIHETPSKICIQTLKF